MKYKAVFLFFLLNEWTHFIHETNTVPCRAFWKHRERLSHTKSTWSHIWEYSWYLSSLASCWTCLKTEIFILLTWWDLSFPLHCQCRPRKWFSGNLRITHLLGRDAFCCCRLHSCLAWAEYWHRHACGVTAFHTLYWPRNYNYSCLFPAQHSSSPLGPAPLAVFPKSSVNEPAVPFPKAAATLFLNLTESYSESSSWMWIAYRTYTMVSSWAPLAASVLCLVAQSPESLTLSQIT